MGVVAANIVFFLAFARASPIFSRRAPGTLRWNGECSVNATLPAECATFQVPLDYTDTGAGSLALDLIKIEATQMPVLGSILFNFGGPGAETIDGLAAGAKSYMAIIGGQYNLIGFNPRGTGSTITFSCSDNQTASAPEMPLLNSSDIATGQAWANAEILSAQCNQSRPDIGQLLGTAFVARDMDQIVQALEEDGFLRYWGFSYGTVLGATFAGMFPDKVGKMILDGVANPYEYYAGLDTQSIVDFDGALAAFYSGCVANATNCALADDDATAESIADSITALLQDLKFNPVPVQIQGKDFTQITYDLVKGIVWGSMYNAANFRELAVALQGLLEEDYETFLNILSPDDNDDEDGADDDDGDDGDDNDEDNNNKNEENALYGIRCGDQKFRSDSIQDLQPYIAANMEISKFAGDIWPHNMMICARWKLAAKERYSGDFKVKTHNPILLIGNTYDPVTPLVAARNISASLQDSVVLHQNSTGHCSSSQPSTCTAKAIRAYFVNGTMPAPDTVCQPDLPLFAPATEDATSPDDPTGDDDDDEGDVSIFRALQELESYWAKV